MAKYVNQKNSKRPTSVDDAYQKVISSIQERNECPFCDSNLKKYHKNPIILNSQYWLVTDNMYPYKGSKTQLLIIHKEHLENMIDVTASAWRDLQKVIKQYVEENGIKGFTVILRSGDTDYTGATVSHLHAHLISGSDRPENPPILARAGNQ